MRGLLVLGRFEYLRRQHGPSTVEAVLLALEEADRAALRGVDRRQWYTFGTLVRLDRAIARLTAPGDDSVYERLGAAYARHRAEWLGADARLYSVHGFLSRVAEHHPRLHSFGEAVYRRRGFCEGELALSWSRLAEGTFCRATLGYLRGTIELLTGAPAAVEERSCQTRADALCHYHLAWSRDER